MNEIALNENDKKLLALCSDRPVSIGNLAKLLNITPASVCSKIKKLKVAKLIEVSYAGRGRKTMIIATQGIDKVRKQVVEGLKQLKQVGEIDFNKFGFSVLPIKEEDSNEELWRKMTAQNYLMFSDLTKRVIKISNKGKQFLKENANKLKPN